MSTHEPTSTPRTGPFEIDLAVDLIRGFATATKDPNPRYLEAQAVPPTLLATMIYRPQAASMSELVPASVLARARSGVHGQHEIVLHRALVPGERLVGFVEPYSVRPARENLRVTFRHPAYDAAGELVAEQWWTTVLIGTSAASEGPELADYSFPGLDRAHPVAEERVRIDAPMVQRYAEVSGDFSEHHFDREAAQRSGMDDVFLHGLCTMALCARAAVNTVAKGDPTLIERFALRFAQPAFLERELDTSLSSIDERRFSLEATCGDVTSIRNGLVELRSAP
jgi:acyl dehydratase